MIRNIATLMASLLLVSPVIGRQPAALNGGVKHVGTFKVVTVHGTPEQMGFAHGYLLAETILDSITRRTNRLQREGWTNFDQVRSAILANVDMPPTVVQELSGMQRGLSAKLRQKNVIDSLGRGVELEDLLLRNSEDLLRAYGCSGFTVWGERAGDAGLVTGRNFDFEYDPHDLEQWMILVRQPAQKKQVATITIPGYIGAFTGWNEDGVCAFMHDGSASPKRPEAPATPLSIVLAQLLETTMPTTAIRDAAARLDSLGAYPFPYMARVITPVTNQVPVKVFRIDTEGLAVNPILEDHCITTNHYIDSAGDPAANADDWSLLRFARISDNLQGLVSPEVAWRALENVLVVNRQWATLHSLVVYPRVRRLDLAMAEMKDGKIVPAPKIDPTTITFDEIFGPYD